MRFLFKSHSKLIIFVIILLVIGLSAAIVREWLNQDTIITHTDNPQIADEKKEINTPIPTTIEPINRNFSIYYLPAKINAPVIANVDGSKPNEYLPDLLNGVAHYKHIVFPEITVDGAFPGEVGNIFLYGHSQIPGADMSGYKGVFNLLPNIAIGEIVSIFYQGNEYRYQVKESKVIEKNQIEYLGHTEKETLTLMTCWPLGLNTKRYIVRAERI